MESVYHCKKCSIAFPTVTRYLKHKQLFCQLGRTPVNPDENVPEDGIGKLTLTEASNRIKRCVELKMQEVNPEVYTVVDKVQQFKSQKRHDCKKANELRKDYLQRISDLKSEAKDLETNFNEKNKRYESIQAYSKVSSIEIAGTEELLEELHDLKNAISYVHEEISANINFLHKVESGDFDFLLSKQTDDSKLQTVSTKCGTVNTVVTLPALPINTPLLTPPRPVTMTTHAVRTATISPIPATATMPPTAPVLRQYQHTFITDSRERGESRQAHTEIHSPQVGNGTVVSVRKPGTADSVVLLGKLQRKREILYLQKEIRDMENEDHGIVRDVLADACQMSYEPQSGIAVYLDYLTPTFHISANLLIAVIKKEKVVSQSCTFVVSPATHLAFLGYNDILPNLQPDDSLYLYSSVQTTQGEELGWCLFSLFSEGHLNSGAWRVPLKSPPFSSDLVSSLYHGVRSLNYSLRIRCSLPTLHDLLLAAPKPKLAQYKLHNPVFTDTLILDRKGQNKKPALTRERSSSLDRVAATYGPPGDFDPVKAIRRSTKASTPMRPMPPPPLPPDGTPAEEPPSPPMTTLPAAIVPAVRVKGLHYHTLFLPPTTTKPRRSTTTYTTRPIPPPTTTLTVHIRHCQIDEEYNILGTPSEDLPPSLPAHQSTLTNYYFFDNQTIELPWQHNDEIMLFEFREGRGRGISESGRGISESGRGTSGGEVGWSWCKYSDRDHVLSVYKTPVPNFQDLVKVLEKYDQEEEGLAKHFSPIPESSFLVRYYNTTEKVPSFPVRHEGFAALPQPRLPTGAFRHVDLKTNFKVHDNKRSITLAIDGARYLPSCVTISRVTGRIFDRNFTPVGPQISSGVIVESDVYNPVYKYTVNVPGNVPNTSVVVFKMYSLHVVSGQLLCVGYSVLNLFCVRGSRQSPTDERDSSVLNEGALQLPLHLDGPDASSILTSAALQDTYPIPCAWLLARVMYTPSGSSVPPIPSYNDGVYADAHPSLSTTEIFLLDSHRRRPIKPGFETFPVDGADVVKKLTRHKGQTVLDMKPSDIVEYSPDFGFGVKVLGIKNLRDCHDNIFIYLRLCTKDTIHKYTDHVLYNDSIQFSMENRVKWMDQIHYFKHVIPSDDVFILVQIIEHKDEEFQAVGWVTIPIFAATCPLVFVNKSLRSEVPLIAGSPDASNLDTDQPARLNSVLTAEDDLPFLVVQIFDSRFTCESKTLEYDVDPEYEKLAREGLQFISAELASKR